MTNERALNLRDFATIYFAEASRLADGTRSRSEFDEELFMVVARELCISQGLVRHLHHCFHQRMFCQASHFGYTSPRTRDQPEIVCLNHEMTDEDIDGYVEALLEKNTPYLEQRVEGFNQQS